MKTLAGLSILLGTLVAPLALSTPSQAWDDCHCHFRPSTHHIAYYRPFYYRAVRYVPVYARPVVHHCYCYPVHRAVNPYAPYPDVFVEDAHVYVPPTYYYSPYTYVDHVLVHRWFQVGPASFVTASPSAVVTAATYVLP